jgi:hypothetical protein
MNMMKKSSRGNRGIVGQNTHNLIFFKVIVPYYLDRQSFYLIHEAFTKLE